MNIAFLTKEYHPSTVDAGFTTVLSLAKEMKKQGHTIVMISGRQKYTEHTDLLPAKKKFEIVGNIPIFRPYHLPWFKVKYWFLDLSLLFNRILAAPLGVKYVQKKLNIKFDIIHSFSSAPVQALNSILAGLFTGKAKKIHSIKSASIFDKYVFSPGGKIFFKLLNFIDLTITPLKYLKNELIKKGCQKDKIYVINSPIDLKKFSKKNKNALRKKYGFKKEEKIALYYGNRVESKGADIIIDAVDYLPEKENITILMFFPTEINKKDLVKLSGKKNQDKIKMYAKKINPVDYLNMVDVVLLPYRHLKATEANPLCLLESFACKVPVITTDIFELKELVSPNKDVLMAKKNNPESLANNLVKLLKDRKLQDKLVKNAHKTVQKFDVKHITQKHIEIYSKLLNFSSNAR